MTAINNIQTAQNPVKKNSLFMFSNNPVIDAAAWGAGGAAAGAAFGTANQISTLKNADKFERAVKSLTEHIANKKAANYDVTHLEKSLKLLQNKKINVTTVKNWAVGIALLTFVPQLIINSVIYAGKKGYDKINGTK